jgi:hypothetical protein
MLLPEDLRTWNLHIGFFRIKGRAQTTPILPKKELSFFCVQESQLAYMYAYIRVPVSFARFKLCGQFESVKSEKSGVIALCPQSHQTLRNPGAYNICRASAKLP